MVPRSLDPYGLCRNEGENGQGRPLGRNKQGQYRAGSLNNQLMARAYRGSDMPKIAARATKRRVIFRLGAADWAWDSG